MNQAYTPSLPGAVRIALLLFVLLALLAPTSLGSVRAAPAAKTVTLKAEADAFVTSGAPNDNYASDPLGVTTDTRSYVKFNLTVLPTGATIDSAVLRLRQERLVGSSSVSVGRVDSGWTETTLTWANQPSVTPGGPAASADLPLDWVEWTVTGLVQSWYDGAQPNHGFALATDDPGVYFSAKETGPAPELVITYSHPDDPDDPADPQQGRPDLADGPDSSNHHGIVNTAYPGPVPGRFPTVWQDPTGAPAGPKHANAHVEAFLGDFITREEEADLGGDADGPNNILRNAATGATGDVADKDRADDGWRNRSVPLPDCRRATLVVRVHKTAAATLERMLLNVWFDGSRDGDWADTGVCTLESGQQVRAYEWIVQNRPVNLAAIPAGGFVDLPVTTLVIHNPTPDQSHWMRFSLSDSRPPLNPDTKLADGRGPHPDGPRGSYLYGESEDVLQRPDPAGQPGELVLTKAVEVPSTPVGYGDTVTYTVRLKNDGGSAPLQTEAGDKLAWPLHLVGPVTVQEISPGASPLFARVEYKRDGRRRLDTLVRWRGTLDPNAEVEIRFPVHVHPLCQPGETTKEIVNTARARKPDGTMLAETVRFQAACPGYSLSDIEVEQEILTSADGATLSGAQADAPALLLPAVQAARAATIRTTFTNQSNEPLAIAFYEKSNQLVQEGAALATEAAAISGQCHIISLESGEKWSQDRQIDLSMVVSKIANEITDDAGQELLVRSTIGYYLLPPDLTECAAQPAEGQDEGVNEVAFHLRPWDLDDAPDSSTHFGNAMTAYADGTQARFPTVFDPATGAEQGPAHARPRPFHLGRKVSLEVEADAGPDADGVNNIVPPADNADQDRFDDGLNPANLNFQHCQVATFPVRVFIHPAAQQKLIELGIQDAYLNVWLDSVNDNGALSHDGDWADALACPDGQTALEHIVIDQAVPINSLVPGLNIVNVTTSGPVPWSPDQPAWLRITLSERESNKTLQMGNIAYGDGRGYSVPFRTGETEAYLLWPQGAAGHGPDLAVRVAGRGHPVHEKPATAAEAALSLNYAKITFGVVYTNRGVETAHNARLAVTFPEGLSGENIDTLTVRPDPTISQELTAHEGIFHLGDVEPGQGGTILFSWVVDFSWKVEEGESFTLKAEVSSDEDVNADNDTSQFIVDISGVDAGFGWKSPDSPFLVQAGTTCSDTIELHGFARPNSQVRIWGDPHVDEQIVTADENGSWFLEISGLADGRHVIQAAQVVPSRASAFFRPEIGDEVIVGRALNVDPISIAFTDDKGQVFRPNTAEWLAGNWSLNLPAGTYTVGVNACGDAPGQEILLYWQDLEFGLKDEDGDGRYEGTITIGSEGAAGRSAGAEQAVSLVVAADGVERVYSGALTVAAPGQVADASNGSAVAGATVTLQAAQTAGSETVYPAWDGDDYGQPNPQTTDAAGGYSFSVPAGSYRLYVTKDGYQSYRSVDLAVADLVNQHLSLTPSVAQSADAVVEIGEAGFSPSVSAVQPGAVVEFVNTDVFAHSVTGSGWDSGLLLSGEHYRIVAGDEGSISVVDGTDPTNAAILRVDAQAGQVQIFLPALVR